MLLAQADSTAAIETATDLFGTWEPVLVMVLVPILTSFVTAEAAEKYVKQFIAVIFTAVACVLTIISDGGFDALDPGVLLARFAVYSSLAERTYRTFSAVSPTRNMNGLSIFAPNRGDRRRVPPGGQRRLLRPDRPRRRRPLRSSHLPSARDRPALPFRRLGSGRPLRALESVQEGVQDG